MRCRCASIYFSYQLVFHWQLHLFSIFILLRFLTYCIYMKMQQLLRLKALKFIVKLYSNKYFIHVIIVPPWQLLQQGGFLKLIWSFAIIDKGVVQIAKLRFGTHAKFSIYTCKVFFIYVQGFLCELRIFYTRLSSQTD